MTFISWQAKGGGVEVAVRPTVDGHDSPAFNVVAKGILHTLQAGTSRAVDAVDPLVPANVGQSNTAGEDQQRDHSHKDVMLS